MATLANALATWFAVNALEAVKVKPPRLIVCPADSALNVTALLSVRAEYPSDLLIVAPGKPPIRFPIGMVATVKSFTSADAVALVNVTTLPAAPAVEYPAKEPVK